MKYFVFFIILVVFSCQSENDRDEIEKIRKVIDEQSVAWNNGDLAGYMSGYFQSDSLRFASGGNVSYGWETTLGRYQNGYPDKATMGELIFSNIDIQLISQNSAMVFGKWELDRENDHPWGLFTLIFSKTDNGWRIIHDHTSSAGKK